MGCDHNAGALQPPNSTTVQKSQSLQDQQFEERIRIAERIAQALREAGYSCVLSGDGYAGMLKRDN